MNKYELVVIVNAQITQDKKESVFKQACEAVVKNGGKIINNQVWLEKHKFAFAIKKCLEGTYYLVKFSSLGQAVDKMKQILRLNEEIVRFAIYKTES